MPVRDTHWPAGTPGWVDLSVPDVDAALTFYGPVIGWRFAGSDDEYGGYRMCQVDGRSAAGIGPMQAPDQPVAWLLYFASDDADATAKLITEHGGTVLLPPSDIDEIGRIAVALDSTGAAFGVWEGRKAVGMEVYGEPGSLVWEDAMLTDLDAGKRFYAAVFGFGYQPVPEIPDDFSAFTVGGEMAGGIGVAEAGEPGHWLIYFSVADVDASVAAAGAGGGRVVAPAENTPFGRIATLADPFGAVFGVHSEAT
ncbi:VOC family protein [Pseudonocardia spinosispora]|uniref:VOC family protein n=1 Tax=Pseudonocardia spinosispora TaxID=103441 RepID=UPI000417F380|nr:VOC family protein [Pseudonocardia spinosispora]